MPRFAVFAFLSVTLAAAACGGKSKGGGGAPTGPVEGDDSATPFNDGAVKAALASSPGAAACGLDASTTMGAQFQAHHDALKMAAGEGAVVNERFACRAQPDNSWQCEWSVYTGDVGSGYIIMAVVSNDGTLRRNTITCNAPG